MPEQLGCLLGGCLSSSVGAVCMIGVHEGRGAGGYSAKPCGLWRLCHKHVCILTVL